MTHVLKELAAVKSAPLTDHSLAFVSRRLADPQNANCPMVVVHKYTGATWSTTVYDVLAHRLYRTVTRRCMRNWLDAIAKEAKNVRVLGPGEMLQLEIVEDARVTAPQFAD